MPPYSIRATRWRPSPYATHSAQAQRRPTSFHSQAPSNPITNFPFNQQRSLQQLPRPLPQDPPDLFTQKAVQKLGFSLSNSYAPQTNRNYNAAVKRYLLFALRCGV